MKNKIICMMSWFVMSTALIAMTSEQAFNNYTDFRDSINLFLSKSEDPLRYLPFLKVAQSKITQLLEKKLLLPIVLQ